MNTLQFIDAMTGRLAWPLAAVVLGLAFRPALTGLLGRVRKLKWRETEAELGALAEATLDVQNAVAEAVRPLPEDAAEGERLSRERVERLLREAVGLGFLMSTATGELTMPSLAIAWGDTGEPSFSFHGPFKLDADAVERSARAERERRLQSRL